METAIDRTADQLWKGSKKWHLFVYHCWSIPTEIIMASFVMSVVFTAGVPDFHCKVDDNSTIPRKQNGKLETCIVYTDISLGNDTRTCSNWTYPDKEFGETIVTEWDLVCEYNYLGELSQSFYIIGAIVGTVVITPLADTYGRKKIYLIFNILLVVTGIGSAFAVNYVMFSVFRILSGAAGYACSMIAVVAAVELFPKELRTFAGQIIFIWWAVGLMFLDLLAYFVRNWRHLQLIVALVPLITILNVWLVPESVPWLLCKGRVKEAEDIVIKASKCNGVIPPEHPFKSDKPDDLKEEKELGRMTLFHEPILRRITLILSLLWFVNDLVYLGLTLMAAQLAGDRFLNFFLMALVEIPSTISCLILLEKVGRRMSLSGFHILAGMSLIAQVFVPTVTASGVNLMPLNIFLTLLGKFSITASCDVVIQYSLELFPTCIRNTGLGTVALSATFAGIIAPFATYLARIVPWAPGLIFGLMSMVVGILTLLLPETKGRPLPHTVDDMKQWHYPQMSHLLKFRKTKRSVNINKEEPETVF